MKKLLNNESGAAEMIGVVIAGLVSIIIGVLIWYKINTAVFTAGPSALGAGTTRAYQLAVWNSSNNSANTVWTLFPIVAIVVVAGVILAIVMGFGRQSV